MAVVQPSLPCHLSPLALHMRTNFALPLPDTKAAARYCQVSARCYLRPCLLTPIPNASPTDTHTHVTQSVTLTRDRNIPKPRATASSAASCRSSSSPRRRTITPAPGSRRQAGVAASASASVVPRGAGVARQNDVGGEKQNVTNPCMTCSLHPPYTQRIRTCAQTGCKRKSPS